MATTDAKIWLALRKRLETLVLSPVHPVAWPNEPFSDTLSKHLEVRFLPNVPERVSVLGHHRYTGILQVSALYPLAEVNGQTYALEIAGLVAQHFKADTKLAQDGVTVRIERAPDVSQGFQDSTMWRTPVSIRYDCFQAPTL